MHRLELNESMRPSLEPTHCCTRSLAAAYPYSTFTIHHVSSARFDCIRTLLWRPKSRVGVVLTNGHLTLINPSNMGLGLTPVREIETALLVAISLSTVDQSRCRIVTRVIPLLRTSRQ